MSAARHSETSALRLWLQITTETSGPLLMVKEKSDGPCIAFGSEHIARVAGIN
jgi:hypothetical protein